jgi:hypothetical protein
MKYLAYSAPDGDDRGTAGVGMHAVTFAMEPTLRGELKEIAEKLADKFRSEMKKQIAEIEARVHAAQHTSERARSLRMGLTMICVPGAGFLRNPARRSGT